MEEKNESVIIEIPVDLKKWSECVIYRVPRKLRKVNESTFTPQLVSIGPFHHGRNELKGMEPHKEKYLDDFCKRTERTKEDLGNFVRDHSTEILAAYAGTIEEIPLQVFDQMILRDSCFILELLCLFAEKKYHDQDDYILRTPWLRNAIKLDLVIFENQLPFSFLKKLYAFAKPRHENTLGSFEVHTIPYPDSEECCGINSCIHFIKGILSFKFCRCVCSQKNPQEDISSNISWKSSTDNDDCTLLEITYDFFINFSSGAVEMREIKHFTDLLRQFWLSRKFRRGERRACPFQEHERYLYSATKLNKAGVKFVPSANKQANLIEFNILKRPLFKFIPFLHSLKVELSPFEIEGNTETLMRNVIALEQCLYPDKAFICNYVALMSQLVDTAEDIEFLVEKRIIKNMLGSNKEVADLVNRLTYKITESNFVYANECKRLNKFYETRFNVVRATLKRVYFNDLWTGSSTVVGLCILIFSVSSTIKTLFFSKQ
ncbi:UPF0481 protein At3g47200-like [Humulus lupulus]|uniref:UPF0481 protein At3g47200-like n=1 Tax=Humulus lupulus TaxID=3486 RepID=UPI002B403BE1|nr:UPF0481 protein At3g47200-like [Humulus lupulus]